MLYIAANLKSLPLPFGSVKKIMRTTEFALQEIKRIHEEKEANSNFIQNSNDEPNNGKRNGTTKDGKVRVFMISAEVPYVMAKAAEIFIRDITTRAWIHTATNQRKTIQKSDFIHATNDTETYDFLIDVIPRVVVTNDVHNNNNISNTNNINNTTHYNAPNTTGAGIEYTAKSNFTVGTATTAIPGVLGIPAYHNTSSVAIMQPPVHEPHPQKYQPPTSTVDTNVDSVSLSGPQSPETDSPLFELTEQRQQQQPTKNDFPSSNSITLPDEARAQNNEKHPPSSTQPTTAVNLIFSPLYVNELQRPEEEEEEGEVPPPLSPGDDKNPHHCQDRRTTQHHLDGPLHLETDDLHQEQHSTTNYFYESTTSPQQQQWTLE
jgi:histone H3/H4